MGSAQAMMSMLLVQIFATGLQLLSRMVLVKGTFVFALIAYRHVVATICVVPFALYFERYAFRSFPLIVQRISLELFSVLLCVYSSFLIP